MLKSRLTQNLLVVGKTPPPLGGVSVYNARFVRRAVERGWSARAIDPASLGGLLALFINALRCPRLVIVGSLRWPALLLVAMCFPFAAKVAVDHNHSRALLEKTANGGLLGRLSARLSGLLLNGFSRVWIVSEHLAQAHKRLGLNVPTKTFNPFLPPSRDEHDDIVASYSAPLRDLLEAMPAPIFVASAYKMVEENGGDLYGFTELLAAASILKDEDKDFRLVFFIANPERTAITDRFERMIEQYGLADKIVVEQGQKQLWPMFAHARALVRPTLTDGRSISIEEALAMGCPVIVSDVVPRPSGVQLFALGKPRELAERMKDMIDRSSGPHGENGKLKTS